MFLLTVYTTYDIISIRRNQKMLEKLRILYHSSIKITDNVKIYIDPFKIKESLHDADFIFITHGHYDHYSPEDIEKIKNKQTLIIAPEKMKNEIDFENVFYVIPNKKYEKDGIIFETVHAYNIGKKFHPKEMGGVGYIIDLNGAQIYIAGDTDINEDNLKVSCDIALVPVGGTYTMNYIDAAELVNKICPKLAIPTHFGSITGKISDGENFKSLLDKKIKCEIITEEF